MMTTARTMKLTAAGLALAAGLGLGGCHQVNQDSYDQLLAANKAQQTRIIELTDESSGLKSALDEMRSRMGSGSDAATAALDMNARLRAELEAANRRIGDAEAKLAGIDMNPIKLDQATDAALQQLAMQNPDVLSYDSTRGMLRFTSDVTFASGNYTLTDAGRRAVQGFAHILISTPAATQYDVLVAGHTDTQPVTLRADRKFANNAELSAYRALAVRDEMVSGGVEPWRAGALAYGETRPTVPNSANGNTPQNRRVEVYLTKGNYNGLTAKPVSSKMAPATTPGKTVIPAGKAGGSTGGGSDVEIAK